MVTPDTIGESIESLKLALGRLERATTRSEKAMRAVASTQKNTHNDVITAESSAALRKSIASAILSIDTLLTEDHHG